MVVRVVVVRVVACKRSIRRHIGQKRHDVTLPRAVQTIRVRRVDIGKIKASARNGLLIS